VVRGRDYPLSEDMPALMTSSTSRRLLAITELKQINIQIGSRRVSTKMEK
jgi:hypothetical protein